jgi:hypothetical protein
MPGDRKFYTLLTTAICGSIWNIKNKITFDQISVEVSCGSDLHGLLFSKLLGMFIWRGRCRDDQAWNSEVDKQSGDDGDKCARGDCRMAALMIEGP